MFCDSRSRGAAILLLSQQQHSIRVPKSVQSEGRTIFLSIFQDDFRKSISPCSGAYMHVCLKEGEDVDPACWNAPICCMVVLTVTVHCLALLNRRSREAARWCELLLQTRSTGTGTQGDEYSTAVLLFVIGWYLTA